MSGRVDLVGAGPGDPALITVAAAETIARAEVVVYDRLVNDALLALAPAGAERIYAGKGPDGHTLSQDAINALLIERARAGRRVVRLKGGDPFIFGRGGEEAEALAAAGVPFAVMPGVSSAVAAPAYAGIPVTHRGVATSVAFVTGHEDPAKEVDQVDWSRLATAVDTLVLLMGVGRLEGIVERLVEAGRDAATPAAVIEWGTLPRQRTVTGTLGDIAAKVREAGIGAPAIVVVGEVVRLRETLRWFDSRPLFGRRVLVTRTRRQASELARALAAEGAEPVELPALEIERCFDEAQLAGAIETLREGGYAWLLLTSANGVEIFFDALRGRGLDARAVRARVAAIGPGTAGALRARGVMADVVAEVYTAEGLLDALAGEDVSGRVLLPRAQGARELLVEALGERGAGVDEVPLYVARVPDAPDAEGLRRLRTGEIDIATFASSSSVRNLCAMLGDDLTPLRDVQIAAIGPVTAATVAELLGRAPDVVASEHTIAGLVRALVDSAASPALR